MTEREQTIEALTDAAILLLEAVNKLADLKLHLDGLTAQEKPQPEAQRKPQTPVSEIVEQCIMLHGSLLMLGERILPSYLLENTVWTSKEKLTLSLLHNRLSRMKNKGVVKVDSNGGLTAVRLPIYTVRRRLSAKGHYYEG